MPANGRWPYCDPRWTHLTRYIKARDGYRCMVCGRAARILDVDHIIPWAEQPDLAFDPSNLRTLCRLHHNRKTHSRRKNSRRW